jgi:hypothetical protein
LFTATTSGLTAERNAPRLPTCPESMPGSGNGPGIVTARSG